MSNNETSEIIARMKKRQAELVEVEGKLEPATEKIATIRKEAATLREEAEGMQRKMSTPGDSLADQIIATGELDLTTIGDFPLKIAQNRAKAENLERLAREIDGKLDYLKIRADGLKGLIAGDKRDLLCAVAQDYIQVAPTPDDTAAALLWAIDTVFPLRLCSKLPALGFADVDTFARGKVTVLSSAGLLELADEAS